MSPLLLRARTERGGPVEGPRDHRDDREKGLLSGKSPTGYAAAAIYAASLLCNEKKTQREVADVAQVEVTIRNRYQEQIEAMGIHT